MLSIFHELIELAIREDCEPLGDTTTDSIFDGQNKNQIAQLVVCSRSHPGIMSGTKFAKYVFHYLTNTFSIPPIILDFKFQDGDFFQANTQLVSLQGPIHILLKGERLFLNLLQSSISIATYTNQFVKLTQGYKAKILDTRKTTPGLRELEKAAVKDGGGFNHRFNLSTGILIKDNHIALAGGIKNAIEKAKANKPYLTQIEVEVDSLEQMKIALELGVDVILLDNFDLQDLHKAVEITQKKCLLEASGGVNLNNVRKIAETGVDFISVGSITQSPPPIDIGLDSLI
jgi:nicotinate-nucleotide pyrophosphorylase (carboxylating)